MSSIESGWGKPYAVRSGLLLMGVLAAFVALVSHYAAEIAAVAILGVLVGVAGLRTA